MNNNNNILWHGWRAKAALHFGVANETIKNWFNVDKPELMEWLKDEINLRKKIQNENRIKKEEILKLAKELKD